MTWLEIVTDPNYIPEGQTIAPDDIKACLWDWLVKCTGLPKSNFSFSHEPQHCKEKCDGNNAPLVYLWIYESDVGCLFTGKGGGAPCDRQYKIQVKIYHCKESIAKNLIDFIYKESFINNCRIGDDCQCHIYAMTAITGILPCGRDQYGNAIFTFNFEVQQVLTKEVS